MRQAILTILAALLAIPALANGTQDFAQKFADEWAADNQLETVTISPKMIEQMIGMGNSAALDERMMEAIKKLRSLRIVKTSSDVQLYYQRAIDLLDRNSTRFQQIDTFAKTNQQGAFYTRKNQQGETVELVMVYQHQEKNSFVVVCCTGDIDEDFFRALLNNFRY